jgi:hypothetical protein
MDEHQRECMNCGGDAGAHLTSGAHCGEISGAATAGPTAPLPADEELMVAPAGERRTLREDGQRRLAVGLVSGFAVLLTSVGTLVARDCASSAPGDYSATANPSATGAASGPLRQRLGRGRPHDGE